MKFLRVIAVCLIASTLAGAEDAHPIGIEEGTKIVLERGDYLPRPLDDRTPRTLTRQQRHAPAAGGDRKLEALQMTA